MTSNPCIAATWAIPLPITPIVIYYLSYYDSVFGNRRPIGFPFGNFQPPLVTILFYLGGECIAHFFVRSALNAVLAVKIVLLRARLAENVHCAWEPQIERFLYLGFCRRAFQRHLLHPIIAMTDVRHLLAENTTDLALPWPVGGLFHILKLMPRTTVHAEVKHTEIRPRVDGVIKNIHAAVFCGALCA